jgi:hypothetical protein
MKLKWFPLFEKDKSVFIYTLVFTILAIVFIIISKFNDNYSIWRLGNGLIVFMLSFNVAWLVATIYFAFLNLFLLSFKKIPKIIFPKSWLFLFVHIFILFIYDNELAMLRFFLCLKVFLIFWFVGYTAKFFVQNF